jgi:voltage-gated potassium channel
MLVLSVYAVLALAASAFVRMTADTRTILEDADKIVCILFLLDFVVTLVRSERRWRYLATWGWLDLVSSIPAVSFLRWGRAVRALRILRVLRGIRATKVLTEFVVYRRAQSTFLAALLVAILLMILSSSAILQFETSPEANIKTPEDALWWSIVTITTVGYGDRFPLSTEGRIIAALLMTAGVGLFGTFSGFVAAWFLEAPSSQSAELQAIARLEAEVRKLHDLLEAQIQEGRRG